MSMEMHWATDLGEEKGRCLVIATGLPTASRLGILMDQRRSVY
jgi:hypothetical protein